MVRIRILRKRLGLSQMTTSLKIELRHLPWRQIEQVDTFGFDFATTLKVLEDNPRRMEPEQKSFELHFQLFSSIKQPFKSTIFKLSYQGAKFFS